MRLTQWNFRAFAPKKGAPGESEARARASPFRKISECNREFYDNIYTAGARHCAAAAAESYWTDSMRPRDSKRGALPTFGVGENGPNGDRDVSIIVYTCCMGLFLGVGGLLCVLIFWRIYYRDLDIIGCLLYRNEADYVTTYRLLLFLSCHVTVKFMRACDISHVLGRNSILCDVTLEWNVVE